MKWCLYLLLCLTRISNYKYIWAQLFTHYLTCPTIQNFVRTNSETRSASIHVFVGTVRKVAVLGRGDLTSLQSREEECLGLHFHTNLWCN
jgi:hypothetical protein